MSDLAITLIRLGLVIAFAASLVGCGVWLACDWLREQRAALRAQREALNTEWRALDRARRIGDVFFAARKAMQQEAVRRPRPPQRPQPPARRQ